MTVRSRREPGNTRVRSKQPQQPPSPRGLQRSVGYHEGFWVTRDGTDARVVCLTCHTGIWHCLDTPKAIEALKQTHRDEGHYRYSRAEPGPWYVRCDSCGRRQGSAYCNEVCHPV